MKITKAFAPVTLVFDTEIEFNSFKLMLHAAQYPQSADPRGPISCSIAQQFYEKVKDL